MPNSVVTGFAALGIITIVKWLVYTGVLWGMIKIQKLNYNVPGLFASSLVATLAGFVPLVGGYLAWVVLVICLWKCTGADIVPDVVFTVAIAGALMFCLNLWAFGALMPDLDDMREAVNNVTGKVQPEGSPGEVDDAEETDPDQMPVADFTITSERPASVTSKRPRSATTNAPAPKPGMTVAARTPEAKPSPLLARISTNMIVVRGISPHTARPTVMIGVGGQVQTLMVGDSFSASTPKGRIHLRCEQITASNVVFSLEDESRFVLHVK